MAQQHGHVTNFRSYRMSSQTIRLRLAAAGLIAAAATGLVMAAHAGGLAGPDRDFLNKAAQGGQFEVLAGKLAAQRAADPGVRTFAQRIVSDHTAANDQLKALADSKQMPLPDAVSDEEHQALGKLEGLNGHEFDQTYADMMVKDHVQDISDFEAESKKTRDPDVKDFAQQTLPTLRHHLMLANRLSTQLKKGT
jgi:putative membrane protein